MSRIDTRNKAQGGGGRDDDRWRSTNKPRAIRVEEDLWDGVKAAAATQGITVAEAAEKVFGAYVAEVKKAKRSAFAVNLTRVLEDKKKRP